MPKQKMYVVKLAPQIVGAKTPREAAREIVRRLERMFDDDDYDTVKEFESWIVSVEPSKMRFL